jgi:hypothetical protein
VCPGDFHPGNVLVAPGGSALHVIDWTNPGVGDRHGDIARTLLWFEIAAVALPRRARRVLMRVLRRRLQRAYLNGYRRVLPVDRERVRERTLPVSRREANVTPMDTLGDDLVLLAMAGESGSAKGEGVAGAAGELDPDRLLLKVLVDGVDAVLPAQP